MATNLASSLKGCRSWDDLQKRWKDCEKKTKGDLFEALVKNYLLLTPEFASKFKAVWGFKEIPSSVFQKLKLPSSDKGIDLIAETKEGDYWAIQCKYREDSSDQITWREISTFMGLFLGRKQISFGLIASTTERITKVLKDHDRVGFLAYDVWQGLDEEFFKRLQARLHKKIELLKARLPRPHQKEAVRDAVAYFKKKGNSRGKLIMPCGTGKSLTSYFIAQELDAKRVLIAVPSLALIRQTLKEWMRESMARGQEVEWICVCSDESAGKLEQDDIAVLTQDLGVPCYTDSDKIADWLKRKHRSLTIVFTTYQSGDVLSHAAKKAGFSFDLGIMDEAHKTTGAKDRLFSHLLHERNIKIRRRLFMTATERRYRGEGDEILSMDDPNDYGETIHRLSFKKALEYRPPILSEYKLLTIHISKDEIADLVRNRAFVRPKGWSKETESATLMALAAFRNAIQQYAISHAVSFHRSISRATAFADYNEAYTKSIPQGRDLITRHVSGKTPAGSRARIIAEFAEAPRALVTNARCLTEGVDVPKIDAILFADPRKSLVDIVQAVGRALRPSKGKEIGYVIVPVLHEPNATMDEIIESGPFRDVLLTIRALGSQDERLIEFFRAISRGKKPRGGSPIDIVLGERLAKKVDLQDFTARIHLKAWNRLAKLSWLPFEVAREFARSLGLKNGEAWNEYVQGEIKGIPELPPDIPKAPWDVYIEYVSMPDWLGTGNVHKNSFVYRKWNKAVTFVRSLGLRSSSDWKKYCAGEFSHLPAKPVDIPSNPQKVYPQYDRLAKKGQAMGYWLGTKELSPNLRAFWPYIKARDYVHHLNLESYSDWKDWVDKQKEMPPGLPKAPHLIYKPWHGWGDFLGSGRIAPQKTPKRPFKDAKNFVHSLKLQGTNAHKVWVEYYRGHFRGLPSRPADIPTNPHRSYSKKEGWDGYYDWTGIPKQREGKCRSFHKAKAYFRKLKISTDNLHLWWRNYLKGSIKNIPPRPLDIPKNPPATYRKDWKCWHDFLGCTAKK